MEKYSLIATLPNVTHKEKIDNILRNPYISSARFNTGMNTLCELKEIVDQLKNHQVD